MKKNAVLILCQYFYPEYVSSATLPTQLSFGLIDKGVGVDVICGQPHDYYDGSVAPSVEVVGGVNIHRVKYWRFDSKTKWGRILNFFSFFVSVLCRIRLIKQYTVACVYTNPPILPLICYWASRISGMKFIFIGFDLYPDNALAINAIKPGGLIDRLMGYVNERVYRSAEAIVAISEDMKEYMLKKHSVPEGKVTVIPNWFTGAVDASDKLRNEEFSMLRRNWDFIVLYTGNMGEAQDMDTILDSIIEMNNANIHQRVLFVFTGHGSKHEVVRQQLIKEKIANAKVYGFLKGQDYSDVLKIADVCLVSLKKGIEGLGVPSKVYGYFAYGKPVIAIMSERTELASVIRMHSAGLIVQQGDTGQFIEAVSRFASSPDLLTQARQGSLSIHQMLYARHLSIDKYHSLLSGYINVGKEWFDV